MWGQEVYHFIEVSHFKELSTSKKCMYHFKHNFIPPAYVRADWQGLQLEAPDIDRIHDFVDYFDRTWVNGEYRISQWNYYDYHGPRTNNHVEGWHS